MTKNSNSPAYAICPTQCPSSKECNRMWSAKHSVAYSETKGKIGKIKSLIIFIRIFLFIGIRKDNRIMTSW